MLHWKVGNRYIYPRFQENLIRWIPGGSILYWMIMYSLLKFSLPVYMVNIPGG